MICKNRLFLLLVFLLFGSGLSAQSGKWRVSFDASPGISWQHYYERLDETAIRQHAQMANKAMNGRLSYELGMQVGYQISPRFYLKTGVSLSRFSSRTEEITYEPGAMSNAVINLSQYFIYDHYFVSIPLRGNWQFRMKRHQFYLETGLNAHLYQKTSTTQSVTERSDGTSETIRSTDTIKDYRQVMGSGFLGIGYVRRWSKHFQVSAGPGVILPIHGMLSDNASQVVNHRLLIVQVNLRIHYSL